MTDFQFTLPGPAAAAENAVLASRRRITEAFANRNAEAKAPGTDEEACLAVLLDALGWNGAPRHVFEAMPHLEAIQDLPALRAVLLRLGIRTETLSGNAAHLAGQSLPCLLVSATGRLGVVLSETEDGGFLCFDGATRASRAVPRAQLTGTVLRPMRTSGEADPAPGRSLDWVTAQIIGMRGRLKAIALLSLGINLLVPMTTLFVMTVYDKAIGTLSLDTLAFLLAGICVALALEHRMRGVRAERLADLGGRIDAAIAINVFSKLLHLPIAMTESAGLGPQLARFRQFEIGRELFQGRLASAILDLPFTLIFFALIFTLGGSLGFVPVALALVVGSIAALSSPVVATRNKLAGDAKVRSDALSVEIATKLRAIREAGASQMWLKRAEAAYAAYVVQRYHANSASALLQTASQACVSISGAGLLGLGAWRAMEGELSVGALVAIMAVAWRVLSPIQEVLLSLHRLAQLRSTIRQIDQLMKMKPEREPTLVPTIRREFAGAISVSGVGFRYPMRQDLSLRGMSFDLKAGEFVAITGPSGSGKSTLLRLLVGLHQPQAGSIRFDGLDLRQLELGDVRRSIGYLPQDSMLFHGTVAQNVRLAAPEATDSEILSTLRQLDLPFPHPMFPEGLSTRVNAEMKEQLSLSIIQRLLLARVLVAERPILFLDEPANYLDRTGDEAFQKLLLDRRGTSTVLMVTARPSHMRLCDRVCYINDGTMVASGTPAEMVPRILAASARTA
ncbi:peptidase domain-containing ABC transporter [Chthonobacter albigriseus]|uniref:peptidase domain-containing ABC transporter n=1 Tax=Chthonobacter albigriseus TaxID=1683161 RepID=UPI0015EE7E0D|nr:ATP-binding cassette domain-containing protein [Chthonobacter albigriseus]